MNKNELRGSWDPKHIIDVFKFKRNFRIEHPEFFDPCGLMVFCGNQGTGKTISAVQYIQKLTYLYPLAILVTNTSIKGINPDTKVIDYDGINCLTTIENGYAGVIYFIDEIHLEFNSLESGTIPIEIMIEVSQQRKQRKHIIGTAQKFNRLAKPFREQINLAVLCRCYFGLLQFNKLVFGEDSTEVEGKLKADTKGLFIWLHQSHLYTDYDTYKKMGRYSDEFKNGNIKKNVEGGVKWLQ